MKFSCYKSDLVDALNFVVKAVDPKSKTPILSCVYIKITDGRAEIHSNNYSTGIIAKIPVATEIQGDVAVSGKRLHEFVKNMPDDTITFNENGNALQMTSGGATVELLTIPPEDFPKVTLPESIKTFEFDSSTLAKLIRETVFAVAKDESRPIFNGVQFEIKNDSLTLVSTNTHRLSIDTINNLNFGFEASFVVPGDALKNLLTKISDKKLNVKVHYCQKFIAFEFDEILMTSRLIEGEFPPYGRVIPQSSMTQVIVDVKEFRNALELINLMAKETEFNKVKLDISGNQIDISANSDSVGEAIKSVDAEITGNDLAIYFNIDYLLDVLRIIDTPKINIGFGDEYSPALFSSPLNNFRYVASPVRA